MPKLTNLVALLSLICSAFALEVQAEDTASLNHWHRWFSLAVAANENGAHLMERTYLQVAFVNHPYYRDLRGAVQQPGMPMSFEDTSFAEVCNSLAWSMMMYPVSDTDYDIAKSLLIVGTEVGGVSWYTADSLATAFALTRDYEEALKWAFISRELYGLTNEPLDGTLAIMAKRSSGIEAMRAITLRNETAVRDKLDLASLSRNRVAPNGSLNDSGHSACFVVFASPHIETATIKTANGNIRTVQKEDLDAIGQTEYERCVKAVHGWKHTKDEQDKLLDLQQRQFKSGDQALNAILRTSLSREPERRPRIIAIAAANANHYFLTWGIDGIVATDAAIKLEANTKAWQHDLAPLRKVAIQELSAIVREIIMAMGSSNPAVDAESSEKANVENRTPTVVMKQPSVEVGEVFVDRSKLHPAFELHIFKYEDEQGHVKEGPWSFAWKDLDTETSETTFLAVQGSRIKARFVWFEIVSDDGTQKCGVGPQSINQDGQLVIKVQQSRRPAILVPQSAYRADEELVHLIVDSESMGLDRAEQAQWLSEVSTMSREKRNRLKEILVQEIRKLAALDATYGLNIPRYGRLYKVVSDDEARVAASP